MEEKPKKVLTEAQRLAFLKGREKRLANIEKRRLEKEEEKEVTSTSAPPPAILVPNDPPPPVPKPKPVPKPAAVEIPQDLVSDPDPDPTPTPKPVAVPVIDEDRIASKVAEIFYSRMEAAKPVRKPRERKPKAETPMSPPAAPRKVANFTWM